MTPSENRDILLKRLTKEIIGPGSDIFLCKEDFTDEVISGKPLQRYFSAILFPKQIQNNPEDKGENEVVDDEIDVEIDDTDLYTVVDEVEEKEDTNKIPEDETDKDETDKTDTLPKYSANSFFPSHYGITFCIAKDCKTFKIEISFGTYIKANHNEIKLPYCGDEVYYLSQYGIEQYISYDTENKLLFQPNKLQRTKGKKWTPEWISLTEAIKLLKKETSNDLALSKAIEKFFFKDKYKRIDHKIETEIYTNSIIECKNQHLELLLAEISDVQTGKLPKELQENLKLHLKYSNHNGKQFVKVVLENTCQIEKNKFLVSMEKVNQLSCFQTEIKVFCNELEPFKDYKNHLFKTDEDQMLDYLYRDKLAFGIGHNTSCTWHNSDLNEVPKWIKSTFLPEYDVRSQSSETDKINSGILSIKNLSIYNSNTNKILENISKVADAYKRWIDEERSKLENSEYGLKNILKCENIYERLLNGIKILKSDPEALRAFQLANTAIYLQMFQSQLNFNDKKEGYEVWEHNSTIQYDFNEYGTIQYPSNREPAWRPFQLAFILQSISSFVDENSEERELVDLLYFPTGGGKTEAYLAASAFLIFWRRLKHSDSYGGVNIIIRYTLRLLSAQQFERASKLILACEFIRNNYEDLGTEKISIGFWVGSSSIPNEIKDAETRLNKLLEKFQKQSYNAARDVNPFQLSNCQWCNCKMISRPTQNGINNIGHRISNNQLKSYCLNEKCNFSEQKGGFPIVLVDEDIYNNPPTILFATVDKFATLAWKDKATSLFNYKRCRKPDLIIQDELHLLNGTLGSLVGLFENALLALCTTKNQKPKIIASTATVKNVDKQIVGLYGREARIFPQYATNANDTFFSKIVEESKRKYIGILPTGKTAVVTNLQLLASLMYARLEIWQKSDNKTDADSFWTILSYFTSLKEIGKFANKINSELKPALKQLQVRYLKNDSILANNYNKLSYRNIELTSRIQSNKIKKNLDKLEIPFDGDLKKHKSYDLVLATNMISVGLDVGRLGVMIMNGMPPNTAEYIQASSRVARKNEGLVVTLYNPINTRDLSFYEDFVPFHKTFYKQVEPLSVTPFAENAMDKMLFTMILAYFRHSTPHTENNAANSLMDDKVRTALKSNLRSIFNQHKFASNDIELIFEKIDHILNSWKFKIEANKDLKYYWQNHPKESLIVPLQDKLNENEILVAMRSMRSVEPSSEITIRKY